VEGSHSMVKQLFSERATRAIESVGCERLGWARVLFSGLPLSILGHQRTRPATCRKPPRNVAFKVGEKHSEKVWVFPTLKAATPTNLEEAMSYLKFTIASLLLVASPTFPIAGVSSDIFASCEARWLAPRPSFEPSQPLLAFDCYRRLGSTFHRS
jgi:hypothetical protein